MEVGPRLRVLQVQDERLSVRRPVVDVQVQVGREQQLLRPAAVRGPPEDTARHVRPRAGPRDEAPVRRPGGRLVFPGSGGQPEQGAPREVRDPDVVLLVLDVNRRAPAVGRDPRVGEVARGAGDRRRPAARARRRRGASAACRRTTRRRRGCRRRTRRRSTGCTRSARPRSRPAREAPSSCARPGRTAPPSRPSPPRTGGGPCARSARHGPRRAPGCSPCRPPSTRPSPRTRVSSPGSLRGVEEGPAAGQELRALVRRSRARVRRSSERRRRPPARARCRRSPRRRGWRRPRPSWRFPPVRAAGPGCRRRGRSCGATHPPRSRASVPSGEKNGFEPRLVPGTSTASSESSGRT